MSVYRTIGPLVFLMPLLKYLFVNLLDADISQVHMMQVLYSLVSYQMMHGVHKIHYENTPILYTDVS